jgi:hypothetical protein
MSDERPCAGYADDWSAYLDAELSSEREALLRSHLEDCDLCTGRVEALRAADAALEGDVPLPGLSADLRERLQARIDADTPTSLDAARARRRRIGPVAGLLAAAAALALYLAVARETPLAPPGAEPEPPIAHTATPDPGEDTSPEPPETLLVREEPPKAPALPEVHAPEPQVLAVEEPPLPDAPATLLEAASEEELALALDLETIEDLDVIENLDLLEALLLLEEETG